MAGTTLRGIGDDEDEENGESEKTSPSAEDQHALSGPTVVDNAKVAEGLKRLRSLDELPKTPSPALLPKTPPPMVLPKTPGPIPPPGNTSTLMGIPRPGPLSKPVGPPAVGTGTLFGIGVPELGNDAVTAPGPLVNPTLSGIVAPVDNDEATVPVNAVSGVIEQDVKGTMMGHDRHGISDSRPPEGARVVTEKGLSSVEFSGGERRFFESEPINTEFEPEFRPTPYARIGAALAVAGVFVACVWGYVRYRRSDTGTTEAQTAPAETTPTTAAAPPAPSPPAAVETPPPAPPPVAALPTPTPTPTPTPAPPAPTPAPVAPTPEATSAAATTAAAPAAVPSPPPSEAPAPPPPAPAIVETPPAPAKPNAGLARLEAKIKETTQVPPPAKPKERAAPVVTDRSAERARAVAKEREQPGEPLPVPTKRTVRPVTSLDGSTPAATPRPAPVPARESPPVAAGLRPPIKPSAPILPATLPPSNKPVKPGKHPREDDPDGTLPLSID